ncbi:MAG: hypothetical protein ACYC7J_15320 [Syntrophales bacterium]
MKIRTLSLGSVGFETRTVTSTAKGGCPKQRTDLSPSLPRPFSIRSGEAVSDFQSYRSMEERYGIQEEGIF